MPEGITGPTGSSGSVGVYPIGVLVDNNILYIDLSDNTTYTAGLVPGADAGADGATGPTGPDGDTGEAGDDGVTGPTGADGADGTSPLGEHGAVGAAGARGATGPVGAVRAAVRGPTGATGSTGSAGAASITAGATGHAGAGGSLGRVGAIGPAGSAGPTRLGPTGPSGAAGPVGARGATGPTGAAAGSTASGLAVTITYLGVAYDFASADGVNKGTYVDPDGHFSVNSKVTTNIGLPDFSVHFRSDVGGGRDEIVFEYGNNPAVTAPVVLTTYDVVIKRDGAVIYTATVGDTTSRHYWNSRWRWQTAVRPVRKTIAELITANFLPQYDGSVFAVGQGFQAAQTYAPMRLAGVYPNMGSTGERNDIGPITEWAADYIVSNASVGLTNLIAQGEAAGTVPWCFRNMTTGAPYDRLSTIVTLRNSANFYGTTNIPFAYDSGHHPSLSYIPFLLTGDPYYLENMQFAVNINVQSPTSGGWNSAGRYLAWPLRDTIHAAKCTPDSVPSWLQTKTYMLSVLTKYYTKVMTYVNNTTDPSFYAFNFINSGGSQNANGTPGGAYAAPWQESFISYVFGWAVALGFTEWTTAYLWKVKCDIARTDGVSGYQRSNPATYILSLKAGAYIPTGMNNTQTTVDVSFATSGTPIPPVGFVPGIDGTFLVTIDSEKLLVTAGYGTTNWTVVRGYAGTTAAAHNAGRALTDPFRTTWSEIRTLNLAIHPDDFKTVAGDPTGMNHLFVDRGGLVAYHQYVRGSLAFAKQLGLSAPADACYTWMDAEMKSNFARLPAYRPSRKWQVR